LENFFQDTLDETKSKAFSKHRGLNIHNQGKNTKGVSLDEKCCKCKHKTYEQSLVSSIAELSGLSKADSTRALEAMIQSIQKGLKEGKAVNLVGFGAFSITKREARDGRNPRTGETIKIAASKTPKFRSGKTLKEAIA